MSAEDYSPGGGIGDISFEIGIVAALMPESGPVPTLLWESAST